MATFETFLFLFPLVSTSQRERERERERERKERKERERKERERERGKRERETGKRERERERERTPHKESVRKLLKTTTIASLICEIQQNDFLQFWMKQRQNACIQPFLFGTSKSWEVVVICR